MLTEEELQYTDRLARIGPEAKAFEALDADPKKAAKSVELAEHTGADAGMIYGNFDDWTKTYKGWLTSQMLAKNAALGRYLESDPMAASVSVNDHDNIDAFYKKWDELGGSIPGFKALTLPGKIGYGIGQGLTRGVAEGWDNSDFAKWITPEERAEYPHLSNALRAASGPFEIAFRGVAAGLSGLKGAIEEGGQAAGFEKGETKRAAREVTGMLEAWLQGMTGFHPMTLTPGGIRAMREASRSYKEIEPYLKAGELPPFGTNAVTDLLHGAKTEYQMSVYDALEQTVKASETKELSPPMWEKVVAQKAGSENLFVHWDAVKKLYGEKLPEPGDGLLGDVPSVAKQYMDALETGTDIQVPWRDWFTKVEDEVRDGLHDDLRFRPGDPTLRETGTMPPAVERFAKLAEDLAKEPEAPPAAPEEPEARMQRLRDEYDARIQTHGDVEGKRTEDGNLLQSLRSTLTDSMAAYPEGMSKAVRWAQLNNRPDIVERALEIANKNNPELYGQLTTMLHNMDRNQAAIGAANAEMASRPLFPDTRPQEVRLRRRTTPFKIGLAGEHSFDITDQTGEAIGHLEVTPKESGKDIYIEWLGTTRDVVRQTGGIGFLGPRHVRSLLTDLMREFPKAETITGDRVTGARPEPEEVTINLKNLREEAERPSWDTSDPGPEFQKISDLLATGQWGRIGPSSVARLVGELGFDEKKVVDRIQQLFEQLGGPEAGVKLRATRGLRLGDVTPYPVRGLYVYPAEMRGKYGVRPPYFRDPYINFIVTATNPIATLGHEFVHHLRTYNFITKKEWATLSQMSEKEWMKKHNIAYRYEHFPEDVRIEEGVTAEFGEWFNNRNTNHPAATIFQKIADFLDRLKTAMKEMLGRDLTAEEIFKKIESGEVARRTPEEGPPGRGAFPLRERAELAEEPPAEEPSLFAKGTLLPERQQAQLFRMIDKDAARDVEKVFNDAYAEAKKRLTPEWKANYAQQYNESKKDLKNRPDFRVSAFFRNGIFRDEKVGRVKIDPKFLTPEQKNLIPSGWLEKGGWNPDDLAPNFGYKTGKEMMDKAAVFEFNKGEDQPMQYLEKLTRMETERRMEQKYGKLDENIMEEAREHAIGTDKFDLMHQETIALATMLDQEGPLSKKDLKDQAALKFSGSISSQVPLDKYIKDLGKLNRQVHEAWQKGDLKETLRLRQQTLRVQAEADFAKQFVKTQAELQRNLKRFTKREVDGVPPEHTNWIHSIMFQIGRNPRRLREDLQTEMSKYKHQTLESFADQYNVNLPEARDYYDTELSPTLPVAEFLKDPNWKKDLDDTTVGQYQVINNTIRALIKIGRKELVDMVEGVEVDRAVNIGRMVAQMEKVGEAGAPPTGQETIKEKMKVFSQRQLAGLMQMDYFWDRLDLGKRGIFTRQFGDAFADAGNTFRDLRTEFSKKLKALEKQNEGVNLFEKIQHDIFYDPVYGLSEKDVLPEGARLLKEGALLRRDLRGVMLNVGNPSNLKKLADGYGTTPEAVMQWVNQHATKEDWKFVQGIWKIIDEIQGKSDEVSFRMNGVSMERIPLSKIQTNIGEIDGGFYSLVYDRTKKGRAGPGIEPNPPPVVKTMTEHGWERKRTNYQGALSLDVTSVNHEITRRLRDIAYREILYDKGKYFRDERFTNAVTRHMGRAYTELLIPYLQDIAGDRTIPPAAVASADRVLAAIQQNTIAAHVGFNVGTIAKHFPTAWVQSFGEIKNPVNLLKAAVDLYRNDPKTMQTNNKFITENSGEIRGRITHWEETLGGATDVVTGVPTYAAKWRERGAAAIAHVDLWAAKQLWLAKYREVMEARDPAMGFEEAHGDAVHQADRSVRFTHGSTAITSRPVYMRTPMFRNLFALYGFFNHIFNRLYRMSWQAGEIPGKVSRGEPVAMDVAKLSRDFFLYVVAPGYIEWWVDKKVGENLFTPEEEDDVTNLAVTVLTHPVIAAVPIAREMQWAVHVGQDPQYGFLGSSMKAFTDMLKKGKKLVDRDFQSEDIGDAIQSANTLAGVFGGLPYTPTGVQVGRWEKWMYNHFIGKTEDMPETPAEWKRGIQTGTAAEPRRRH